VIDQPSSRQTADARRLTLTEYTTRVLVTALIVILLLAMWRLRDALMLTFLSVTIAIALQLPVSRLERMGLSHGVSILITMVGLLVVIVLAFVLIIPAMVEQVSDLANELPDAFEQARDEYDRQAANHSWMPDVDWDEITEGDVPDFLTNQASNLSRNIFPFLTGVGGVIANLIVIIFISIFFVTDPANYLEGLLTMVPRGYRPRALDIFVSLGNTLRRWFIGQLISMLLSGTMITLATGIILGLPNPLALGVISGMMEFVPNIGSLLAIVPAIIIALADDPGLVPWVIVTYLLVQQIQSNLIMPRIMTRQVNIPAAVVLIAQVMAAALFGFMGLVLAMPLAVLVMVLVREIYVYDVLNTRAANIERRVRADGSTYIQVTADPYRPEQLTPGQAAARLARGESLFEAEADDNPLAQAPALIERTARSQQAVWIAVLTLAFAQALALIRSLLGRSD